VTEHVTWDLFDTVGALKAALAACTDVVRPRAAATPTAESATATISPNNASLFLDMVSSWSGDLWP
jgi:hypothetical protein